MCPPDYFGIEYEINPWMNVQIGSDAERAPTSGMRSTELCWTRNVAVELIEPVEGLPDLVFTANCGLVYENIFISSRFRYGVRQGEAPHFERWRAQPRLRGREPARGLPFRGGRRRLFCGETLFAGYRFRSDVRSHQWIGERLGLEVLPLELVDPRFYHLDTCFCPLAPDLALYYPGAFDEYGRSVLARPDSRSDRGRRRGSDLV